MLLDVMMALGLCVDMCSFLGILFGESVASSLLFSSLLLSASPEWEYTVSYFSLLLLLRRLLLLLFSLHIDSCCLDT